MADERQRWEAANSALQSHAAAIQSMLAPIRKLVNDAKDDGWKNIKAEIEMKDLGRTANAFNTVTWPTGAAIGNALKRWHELTLEELNAFIRLPDATQRTLKRSI